MSIKDGIVLRICRGPSCGRKSPEVEQRARDEIAEQGLGEVVGVEHESCFGRCFMGPNILVERWRGGQRNERAMLSLLMNLPHPDMRFEHGVLPSDIPKLVAWHLERWLEDRDREE